MHAGERYVLGALVGEGATAFVHEAQDTLLSRRVAVKVFRDADPGADRPERISEEIRILTALSHPHLLPLYDAGRDRDGRRFLVMPLVRGTTLARRAARGPVPPREVKRVGAALADALSHIHALGIVHRDVKPSNVLLDDDGTVYLADFGFAHADDSPALTASNCVVGTAGYLAPEQAEGAAVTPAADVYALGLVLLEALTGERTYRGTPLERAVANALRPPVIPARLGPGWFETLQALTAREPADRPPADRIRALIADAEDELPAVGADDGTMELTPVLGPASEQALARAVAQAPAHGAGQAVGQRAGQAVGQTPAHGADQAAGQTVDRALDRASDRIPGQMVDQAFDRAPGPIAGHTLRRAAIGAAALAAAAVIGIGAGTNWLSPGAGAAPAGPPSQSPREVPGAGVAGGTPKATTPSPTPTPTLATVSAPAPAPAAVPPPDDRHPADQASTGPAKCRHGKHKC